MARQKKLTKEELEKLLVYRKKLIKEKAKRFSKISDEAKNEISEFPPCEKCKFISKTCHKTCGISMKFLTKAGKVETTTNFGNRNRITTEDEFLDTASVRLGLSEEVDKSINDEYNGEALAESEGIRLGELESIEVSED